MKILYLDESGINNVNNIDLNYPIFMLGGVIVDSKNCKYNKSLMDKFKSLFGLESVILHSSEIQHKKNGFSVLKDENINRRFVFKLNTLMKKLKYQVIVCLIDLKKYSKSHKNTSFDLYYYALTILIEKFIYELENDETGFVFVEGRNKVQNKQIMNVFDKLKINGTKFIRGNEIKRKIRRFQIIPKNANYTGLQIADLVLSPIGRHYLNKKTYEDFDIVYSKCLSKNGNVENIGITIVPKK